MSSNKLLRSEWQLTSEQLKAIGCLAVESTHLELFIDALIRSIGKLDDVAFEVFLGRLTIEPKTQILRDLLWPRLENMPKVKKSFKLMYDDIKDMITKRNTVIHGIWGSREENKMIRASDLLTLRAETDAVARRKKGNAVAAADVMDLVRRFDQRQSDLLDWWISYERALPEKSDERHPRDGQK